MRKALFLAALAVTSQFAQAQIAKKDWAFPSVALKDMEGRPFNTADIKNDGKPVIVSFWATWCKPCILELNNIADVYADWEKETGVKVIAVSIDDSRNSSKVAPLVSSKGWKYQVLLDENSDLRRAMNVNNVPHTFLLNGNMEVVYQHTSYSEGDEEHLYEEVKKTLKK